MGKKERSGARLSRHRSHAPALTAPFSHPYKHIFSIPVPHCNGPLAPALAPPSPPPAPPLASARLRSPPAAAPLHAAPLWHVLRALGAVVCTLGGRRLHLRGGRLHSPQRPESAWSALSRHFQVWLLRRSMYAHSFRSRC